MSNIVTVVLAFVGVCFDYTIEDNTHRISVYFGSEVALLAEVFPEVGNNTFDLYAMDYSRINARRMFSIHI